YYAFFSKLLNLTSDAILHEYFPHPETGKIQEKFLKVYSELLQNILQLIDLQIPLNIRNDPQLVNNYVKLKTRKLRNSIVFYSEIKHELIEYATILHNSGEKFNLTTEDIYEVVNHLDIQLAQHYTQHLESPWKIGINIIKTLDIHAFLYLYNKIPVFRLIDLDDLNIQRNRQKQEIIRQILDEEKFSKLIEANRHYTTEDINKLRKEYAKKIHKASITKKITPKRPSFLDKEISLIVQKLYKSQQKKTLKKDEDQKQSETSDHTSPTHIINASTNHGSIIFTPFQLLPSEKNAELLKKLQTTKPVFDRIKYSQEYLLVTSSNELIFYSYSDKLIKQIQSLLHLVNIPNQITEYEQGFVLIIITEGVQRWKDLIGLPPMLKTQSENYFNKKKLVTR
ncbi:hypothetical protein LCGC14_2412180, partial [marine sediment metagenome]